MFSFDFTVISFWGFVIFTILFRLRFVNAVHGSNLIQLLSPAAVIAYLFSYLSSGANDQGLCVWSPGEKC